MFIYTFSDVFSLVVFCVLGILFLYLTIVIWFEERARKKKKQ